MVKVSILASFLYDDSHSICCPTLILIYKWQDFFYCTVQILYFMLAATIASTSPRGTPDLIASHCPPRLLVLLIPIVAPLSAPKPTYSSQ